MTRRIDGRPPLFIAGAGMTEPSPEDPRSIVELALAAVSMALAEAGHGHERVDAIVTASVDLLDGLTASNIAVTEVVGAVMRPETRISADGLAAALQAVCQILSGVYETVLVVAHAKTSMADYQDLSRWAFDPIHLQPLGLDFLACAALQAQVLAANDATAEGRWADIAAQRRQLAGNRYPGSVSSSEVLASPVVSSPLRAGMCAPLGDGACAVVISSKPMRPSGVVIVGGGWDLCAHGLGDRDLRRWDGLTRAYRRACASAGIAAERASFDLAEPSCFYAHEEELFRGAIDGECRSMSPTGGLFAGSGPIIAGLSRLVECARAIHDGKGQSAIAHGQWGAAGQGQAVALLEAA